MKLDFMNVKREREKHITRLHIILFSLVVLTIIIVVISVGVSKGRKISKYRNFEKNLKTATLYYYGDKANDIGKGEMVVVTMKKVVDNGYLQDSLTNTCTGYTIIKNNRNLDGEFELEYDPYIKCGDSYVTDGFDIEYLK